MSIRSKPLKAIRARLLEIEALGRRVYPELRVKGQYPQVVYARRDASDPDVLGTPTIQFATVDVVVVARTYEDLQDAVDAVEAAVNDQRGEWGGISVELCIFADGSNADDDVMTITDTSNNVKYCLTTLSFELTTEA